MPGGQAGRGATTARYRLSHDPEALTAVVATILMVAITIAIAGTVFVIVQIISKEQAESAPTFGLRLDETTDRLWVTSASPEANWDRILVHVTNNPGAATAVYLGAADPYMSEPAATSGADILAARSIVSSESNSISPDDYLEFCADIDTAGMAVSVFDEPANARLGTWNFESVAAC